MYIYYILSNIKYIYIGICTIKGDKALTSRDNLEDENDKIESLDKQLYVVEINEHKRVTVAKKKPAFVKRKGFGGYHKRKPKQYNLKLNVKRQLRSWEHKLESLDTTKPMLFITLTTQSTKLSFEDLKDELDFLLGNISGNFKSYCGYLRRFGLTEKLYKHVHLILFFNNKHAPRELTRKWIQQYWNLGNSIVVKKVYDYAGVKNYICKEESHTYFKENGIEYSYYDYGLKIISSSQNLKKTKDTIKFEVSKEDALEIVKNLNLKHKHENYHYGNIKGKWEKIIDRYYFY